MFPGPLLGFSGWFGWPQSFVLLFVLYPTTDEGFNQHISCARCWWLQTNSTLSREQGIHGNSSRNLKPQNRDPGPGSWSHPRSSHGAASALALCTALTSPAFPNSSPVT